MPRPAEPSFQKDLIAGLAVFFSMSYVAFANPAILQSVGFAAAPVFYATCLVAAVGCFISGAYAHAPAALASGLALSSALKDFLSFPQTTIGWESALVVCFFAGFLLLIISVGGYRRRVLDAIPPIIKLAVVGGIGAILADTALTIVRNHSPFLNYNMRLFFFGLAIIVIGYIIIRSRSLYIKNGSQVTLIDAAGRSSFFISVVLVAVAAYFTSGSEPVNVPSTGTWLWLETSKNAGDIIADAFRWESISLLIFIFYILVADIVGSPYHLAHDDEDFAEPLKSDGSSELTIKRSFLVDSFMNLAAPIAGTSPVVYYAENLAGKILGGRGAVVAYVPAIGFLALFFIGVALAQSGRPITFLIPGIAIAPVLFFVGLMVISKALWGSAGADGDVERGGMPLSPLTEEFLTLGRRLPPALAIVVTPVAGFEVGVAFGILSYALFFLILPPQTIDQSKTSEGPLTALTLLALVAVIIKLKLLFGW